MRSKQLLEWSLPVVLLTASVITAAIARQTPTLAPSAPANLVSAQDCSSDDEIIATVRALSHGGYADQQKALTKLKANAELSTMCRNQVITRLLSAMDQPDVELTAGTPQFYLWHYGTQLLGELKAVEALDLLVKNFDRHDGSAFPLNHHPALGGVISMGEIALPKLQSTLKEHPDPHTRQYAVFCIALIGGESAERILQQALTRESDRCTASCIRATLASFNNKRRPHQISDEGRTEWYSTFLCAGE